MELNVWWGRERAREEDWCAVNQLVCKWDESEGETVWTEEGMRRIWKVDWHWDDTTHTLNALWSMVSSKLGAHSKETLWWSSISRLKFLFLLRNTHTHTKVTQTCTQYSCSLHSLHTDNMSLIIAFCLKTLSNHSRSRSLWSFILSLSSFWL